MLFASVLHILSLTVNLYLDTHAPSVHAALYHCLSISYRTNLRVRVLHGLVSLKDWLQNCNNAEDQIQ